MVINITAVLVAALVMFIIGFLMHGPLFGTVWMRLAKITPPEVMPGFGSMWKQMLQNYIANVVTATVMAMTFWVIFSSGASGDATAFRGAIWGFWLWFGFMLTSSSMEYIWMGRSAKHWLFDAVSALFGFIAMGAILAAWM